MLAVEYPLEADSVIPVLEHGEIRVGPLEQPGQRPRIFPPGRAGNWSAASPAPLVQALCVVIAEPSAWQDGLLALLDSMPTAVSR